MPKVRHQIDIHNNVMDKQDALQKKSTTYSTQRIQELNDEIIKGGKPDTTPFFHGSPDWRDSGIIFEYTDEELDELQKCAEDCEYFVGHYCKFLNSKGRTLVKLRPYQSRILKVMGEEKWDAETETVVPEHNKICLMQSRQSGKCLSMNSSVDINLPIDNSKYNILNFLWSKIEKKLSQLKKRFASNARSLSMLISDQGFNIAQMNAEM